MKKISRLTTAVGAFTLGMGLLGTTFAMAAPPSPPAAPTVPVKVDTKKDVSFTIVKYSGPEVEGDNRPSTPANQKLQGIKFKVTRIDYQAAASESAPTVGTAAWWEWAYSQKADGALNKAQKATSFELTTDEKGQACLSNKKAATTDVPTKVEAGTKCTVDAENVKQGLYLVEETGTTSGGKNYRGALPFFITLPLAEGSDTESAVWNYDPIIEPKNQEFSLEKKLTDAGANEGIYSVSSSIPSSGLKSEGKKLYDELYPFGIEDIYPAALEPKAGEVKVFVKGNTQPRLELVKDTDFKASAKEASADAVDTTIWKNAVYDGNSLAVYFTAAGATKLADAVASDPTAKVYFDLPFTIKNHGQKITNEVVPHDPNSKKKPTQDRKITNDDAQFINLKITKVDAQNNGTKLEGAVFNFYKCTVDAEGNLAVAGKALPGFATSSGYDNIDNSTYDFSTAAGTGEVTAYHVLNAAKVTQKDENGVPSADKYVMCAVEKTAPTGYKKNPYPIKVETASTEDGAEVAQTITNTQETFFDRLPKTGAAGIVLLLVLGGAMVIAGAAMRRRSGEEA